MSTKFKYRSNEKEFRYRPLLIGPGMKTWQLIHENERAETASDNLWPSY